ncbi:hypothetical protein ACI2KG_18945 [Pseudomonas sp. NPDC089407]|uniref:hypothetical protein n=1 Tax=Pseudomonas sp. NPDC089407 TaxID=3364464 RepID=UPI00384FF81F
MHYDDLVRYMRQRFRDRHFACDLVLDSGSRLRIERRLRSRQLELVEGQAR